jgi:hypothetical protein
MSCLVASGDHTYDPLSKGWAIESEQPKGISRRLTGLEQSRVQTAHKDQPPSNRIVQPTTKTDHLEQKALLTDLANLDSSRRPDPSLRKGPPQPSAPSVIKTSADFRLQVATWRKELPQSPTLSQKLKHFPWLNLLVPAILGAAWIVLNVWLIWVKHINWGTVPLNVPFIALVYNLLHTRTPESVRELMDFPSLSPQFPVSVTMSNKRGRRVRDIGIVTFSDDLLHFQGRRTSFDLLNLFTTINPLPFPDNSPKINLGKVQPSKQNSSFLFTNIPLSWSIGDSGGRIQFTPYQGVPGIKGNHAKRFHGAMHDWQLAKPVEHELITLPPKISK